MQLCTPSDNEWQLYLITTFQSALVPVCISNQEMPPEFQPYEGQSYVRTKIIHGCVHDAFAVNGMYVGEIVDCYYYTNIKSDKHCILNMCIVSFLKCVK